MNGIDIDSYCTGYECKLPKKEEKKVNLQLRKGVWKA